MKVRDKKKPRELATHAQPLPQHHFVLPLLSLQPCTQSFYLGHRERLQLLVQAHVSGDVDCAVGAHGQRRSGGRIGGGGRIFQEKGHSGVCEGGRHRKAETSLGSVICLVCK